jgi:cytoskeletal protein CcmA (bactofilin family)
VRGLVVVGETGRVTCQNLKANSVIVAGTVNGSITAEKLDIRSTGRVWGDVIVVALATEEGAFLRGQVRMEEKIEIAAEPPEGDAPVREAPGGDAPAGETPGDESQPAPGLAQEKHPNAAPTQPSRPEERRGGERT